MAVKMSYPWEVDEEIAEEQETIRVVAEQQRDVVLREAEQAQRKLNEALTKQNCAGALRALTAAAAAWGKYNTENRYAGGGSSTRISNASSRYLELREQFTKGCVRATAGTLSGPRRKRRP